VWCSLLIGEQLRGKRGGREGAVACGAATLRQAANGRRAQQVRAAAAKGVLVGAGGGGGGGGGLSSRGCPSGVAGMPVQHRPRGDEALQVEAGRRSTRARWDGSAPRRRTRGRRQRSGKQRRAQEVCRERRHRSGDACASWQHRGRRGQRGSGRRDSKWRPCPGGSVEEATMAGRERPSRRCAESRWRAASRSSGGARGKGWGEKAAMG
jgi:hypothetical protein